MIKLNVTFILIVKYLHDDMFCVFLNSKFEKSLMNIARIYMVFLLIRCSSVYMGAIYYGQCLVNVGNATINWSDSDLIVRFF